jgi:nucleotide-binding universal stress UspA family protein
MLVRLQSAIGRDDLIEQMVLLSPKTSCTEKAQPTKSVNLIVGYNSSPNSHTALDIAFWIAHQTRLATNVQVMVQAVYVVEDNQKSQYLDVFHSKIYEPSLACPVNYASKSITSVLSEPKLTSNVLSLETKLVDILTHADRILWQARSLAEEWQGSFKAHLRFGCVAEELQKVVKLEAADILFLGCQSINHPIIQTLESNLPCVVLGIPNCINI